MDLVPNSNLVFLHIPKTAGLSIRSAFAIKTHGYEHSIKSDLDKTYMGGEYVRFTVIRDPIKRFVSAFKYNGGISKKLPTGIRKILANSEELRSDINSFTDYLRKNYSDIGTSSDHFRRQIYFIRLAKPHIILRQENLENDIEIVRNLAPGSFKGLPQKNISDIRFDTSSVNTVLSVESEQFVRDYYKPDLFFLGYES